MENLLALALALCLAALPFLAAGPGSGAADLRALTEGAASRLEEARIPGGGDARDVRDRTPSPDPTKGEEQMQMKIDGVPVAVAWEDNDSVAALRELARDGLTLRMSMYGGFEQVGPIGSRLPRSDRQTTTASGDVVLYSGDQLVVFYGSNSWAYTPLGRVTDRTPEQMRELLGNGDVTITLTTN